MSGKGWFSSAISGLESRLDTILAEDDQASAKSRAAEAAAKAESTEKTAADTRLAVEPASRNSSRSRPSSTLQDRLAKAVNKGTADRADAQPPSHVASRPESPVLRSPVVAPAAALDRTSIDSKAPGPDAAPLEQASGGAILQELIVEPVHQLPTTAPLAPMPPDTSSQAGNAMVSSEHASSSPTSADIATVIEAAQNGVKDPDTDELLLQENREELNAHLERIDALQSKLTYLNHQLARSAKDKASDPTGTAEAKLLSEKDVQIATLMQEGQNLSKSEMKHLANVKKLRSRVQEQDKELTSMKLRLAKVERDNVEQTERAKRAEAAERAAQEKLKVVGKLDKEIDVIRSERTEAARTIQELRSQLNEARLRGDETEKRIQSGALEAEKRISSKLREDLENLRIEKKLADDRAKRQVQTIRDEAKAQLEKSNGAELELRNEITNLESKLEVLRSRTEEVSSSATGESQAKLLRQIETLQTQYSLASQNWQGIETSLTARVAALEKERDDTARREIDFRRKARELSSKARRLEDELEIANERARVCKEDLDQQQATAHKLQVRLEQAESLAQNARAELDRARTVWEIELQQQLEDEKMKSKTRMHSQVSNGEPDHFRTDSPSMTHRNQPMESLGLQLRKLPRSVSGGSEMPVSPIDYMFEEPARRPSSSRHKQSSRVRTPDIGTPQRQDSIPVNIAISNGGFGPDTPSIFTVDHDDPFDNISSPRRTINDMLSVSTVGAGPSVQLVERMSAAVRRLESEKAVSKEELSRLYAQRDEAREEVVALMRDIEQRRAQDQKIEELEQRLGQVDERYQTTLEMLGEKTERVEELESDVDDLKKMYRELVQTMK
ncbi:hypothetical protein ACN47E_001307 [Coniothyrium glycines]